MCTQLCQTLCNPMYYCRLPGSSVHGIFPSRVLVWVAFPSPAYLPDPGIEPVSLGTSCIGRQIPYHSATWEASGNEQRHGNRVQVTGNHTSSKQRGSTGRQRNAETSRLTDNFLEADKEGQERQESPALQCNLVIIVLSLQ